MPRGDKDETAGIRPGLELLPLLASPGDLRSQLLGGQNAFFEAQTFGMSKAPDLHVIDLHAALGQLGNQSAQGEIGLRPIQQPVTQIANQQPRLVTPDLARSRAAQPAKAL